MLHKVISVEIGREYEMGVNIGFDADGVLFDTESFQLSAKSILYMKKVFGLTVEKIDGYGIKDIFACISKIEMKYWTHFVFQYSLFFRARPWVKEVFGELRKDGNHIYIITSKVCSLENNYRGIIVRLLFEISLKINGIHVDGIEYCSLSNSGQNKLNACKKQNIHIMVEDNKENIGVLSEYLHVLCFDSLNNQDYSMESITRVKDFNEVYINVQRLIGLITYSPNDFTKYTLKSKSEKIQLEISERKKYNEWLKRCYQLLPLDNKRLDRTERRMYLGAKIFAPLFIKKYHPVISGIENTKGHNGIIFVCNHLCDKDMILLFSALYPKGIVWHPLIKKEILDKRVGIIFRYAYSVFVDRENVNSRHIATQELAKLLVNGYNILIFPEGTYNKTQKPIKDFAGVGHVYLSQILQKPIINCALTKDYKNGPVLKIDRPYVVSEDISIEEAVKDSFDRLSKLVDKIQY